MASQEPPEPSPPEGADSRYGSTTKIAVMAVLLVLGGVLLVVYLKRLSQDEPGVVSKQLGRVERYERWYRGGTQKMGEGNYAEAVDSFQHALQIMETPWAAEALDDARRRLQTKVGKDAEAAGELDAARQAYQQADQIKSTQESKEAIERVERKLAERRVSAQRAGSTDDVSKRVAVLERKGDWQEVVDILEGLRDKVGQDPKLSGRLEVAKLRVLEARVTEQQQRLRHSHRRKLQRWIQEARQLLQVGKRDEAAQVIDCALALDPDNLEALALRRACEGKANPPEQGRPATAKRSPRKRRQPDAKPALARALAVVPPRPKPVAAPRPEPPVPAQPPKAGRARAFWPHAKGDTWRYRAVGAVSGFVTYEALGGTVKAGVPCLAYDVATLGADGSATTRSLSALLLQPGSLSRVDDSGGIVKQYALPLKVGQRFAFQTPGTATEQVLTQPTKVEVITERREALTTPAGRFDCFVIKTVRLQKRFALRTAEVSQWQETQTDWVCPGVGLVKRESVVTQQVMGRPATRRQDKSSLELIEYDVQTH